MRGKLSLIWMIIFASQGLRAASWIVVWISSLAIVVCAGPGAERGFVRSEALRIVSCALRSLASCVSVMRVAARSAASPSSSARTSWAARTSHGEGTWTTAPRFGTTVMRPPDCSWRSASRTGVRLTPNSDARAA